MKPKVLIERTTGEVFVGTDHVCVYDNPQGPRWINYEEECGYIDGRKVYPTIILIEDHIETGHYYHHVTLLDALLDGKRKGAHRGRAYCYDRERHTLDRAAAKDVIPFD